MPKLSPEKARERVSRIQDAARDLFTSRGFHAVGLRDVAQKAGVSTGNLYNYFGSKKELFASLLNRLHTEFTAPGEPLAQYLIHNHFPDDLPDLGRAVGEMVARHTDYLTLVYVDLAELSGSHARSHYQNLASRFGAALALGKGQAQAKEGAQRDVDPAVAFTLVYMQFFSFFITERLLGARNHLGLSEEKAVEAISLVFRQGLGGQK